MSNNFHLRNNQMYIIKNTAKDSYSWTPDIFTLHCGTLTCFRNTVPLTKHRIIVSVDSTHYSTKCIFVILTKH